MSNWKTPAFALFALLSLSPTAFARTHFGTVALTDGQRIEEAHYKVKPLFQIVEITQIDTTHVQRKLRFDQIEAIFDSKGKDVTRKYLGRYARMRMARLKDSLRTAHTEHAQAIEDTDWDSPFQRRSAAPLRPRIKLWNIAVGVGGNFSVSGGNSIAVNNPALGFDTKIVVPVNSFLAIRGTVSHTTEQSQNAFLLSTPPSPFPSSRSSSTRSYTRAHIAGQYYFYNRRETYPPSFVGFIYTGAGLMTRRDTYSSFVEFDSTGIPHYSTDTETRTNLLNETGVGFDAFLTPSFGLEFGASFGVVFLNPRYQTQAKYGYIFDLRLGVMTFF